MLSITAGCDPEVAIFKGSQIISACDMVPGTKNNPFPVEGSLVGLMLQEDNVSLEFNIKACAARTFSTNIQYALKELTPQVEKYFGKGAHWVTGDAFEYDPRVLTHPKAMAFGCDPDFLAHERGAPRMPVSPAKAGRMRYFAGHIHVGYDTSLITEAMLPKWALVQGMEWGGYLHNVVNGRDPQPGRRKMYGLPGLFRPKPYGVEYRTPSNFWLNQTAYAEYVINAARSVLERPKSFRRFYDRVNWVDVQELITTEGQCKNAGSKFDVLSNMWEDFRNTEIEISDPVVEGQEVAPDMENLIEAVRNLPRFELNPRAAPRRA